MGTDSAIIEFDSTKMDRKGEKTTEKKYMLIHLITSYVYLPHLDVIFV